MTTWIQCSRKRLQTMQRAKRIVVKLVDRIDKLNKWKLYQNFPLSYTGVGEVGLKPYFMIIICMYERYLMDE